MSQSGKSEKPHAMIKIAHEWLYIIIFATQWKLRFRDYETLNSFVCY